MQNYVGTNQQLAMQAKLPPDITGAPVMQGDLPANAQRLEQNARDSYVGGRAQQIAENNTPVQVAISVPIWYGLSQSMDYFAKKCRGEYPNSAEGKMGAWGDNVVNKLKKINPEATAKASSWWGRASRLFQEKVVNKVGVLKAFRDTPAEPTNKMALAQREGMTGFLTFDYEQVADGFLKRIDSAKDLEQYGPKGEALIKDVLNKTKTLLQAEFEALGGTGTATDEALKNLKAKALGYKDLKEFELIKQEGLTKHLHRVIEACHESSVKFPELILHRRGLENSWLRWLMDTKPMKYLLGRKVKISEFTNKFVGSLGEKAVKDSNMVAMLKRTGLDTKIATTKFGRLVPKYSNLLLEGATNRVAGGKIMAAMQAFFLAEAVMKTAQAKGVGDKVKTFMERVIELIGFFVFMPLGIQAMYRVGGMQYAGTTLAGFKKALGSIDKMKGSLAEKTAAKKILQDMIDECGKNGGKAVEAYRTVLKNFNEKSLLSTSAREFVTQEAHKGATKGFKKALMGETTNIFAKLGYLVGRVVNFGNEVIRGFSSKAARAVKNAEGKVGFGQKFADFFTRGGSAKFALKDAAGYPLRFVLAMFILLPFLNKFGVKFSHLIFGRPEKSVLDKEQEVKPEQHPEPETVPTAPVITDGSTNLLNKYRQQPAQPQIMQQAPLQPSQTNLLRNINVNNQQTIQPQPEPKKEEKPVPVRTYVPSTAGVKVTNNVDTTPADAAMRRADSAEKKAMETLAMKW